MRSGSTGTTESPQVPPGDVLIPTIMPSAKTPMTGSRPTASAMAAKARAMSTDVQPSATVISSYRTNL